MQWENGTGYKCGSSHREVFCQSLGSGITCNIQDWAICDIIWLFVFFYILSISDVLFLWKVDKKELLQVERSFYISRHPFSQILRTSFNIIWKKYFHHESWESGEDWFWPFEPISKLKTTFCKNWTSIKFSTESMTGKQK